MPDDFNPDNPYGSSSIKVEGPDIQSRGGESVVHEAPTRQVSFDELPKREPAETTQVEVNPEADKGQQGQPEADAPKEVPPMPANGFEKFYDAKTGEYNWQAHAVEAEFKLAQAKASKKETAPKADEPKGDDETNTEAANAAVEAAGLEWDELSAEVIANGDISKEQREALNKVGIPDDVIDTHIAGISAMGTITRGKMEQYVGGSPDPEANAEAMNGLLEWAGENIPEADIPKYNQLLKSPNWKIAIDSLQSLHTEWEKTNTAPTPQPRPGEPAQVQQGDNGAGTSNGAFASFEDQIKAQQDPRYNPNHKDFDPQYRQSVIRRISMGR